MIIYEFIESKNDEPSESDTSRIDAINATDRSILDTENRLVSSDSDEEGEEDESEFDLKDEDRIESKS